MYLFPQRPWVRRHNKESAHMNRESREFLEALLATSTPSGFESEGQKLWKARTARFADSVRVDVHGNVIAGLNEEAPTRVMLAGHCDEIGLMVTHIDDQGYVYFAAIGGVDPAVLPGARVKFLGPKGLQGVIGRKPIHLMESSEKEKSVDIKHLWIDIGARNRKDAEKHVSVGTPACVVSGYVPLLNGMVASRAWDDKAGAFVVSEALRLVSEARSRLKVAVYAVATVQEEVGCRGAVTSGYGIEPTAAIAVDVGFATDSPGVEKKQVGDVRLGRGPILHRGPGINIPLGDLLAKTASRMKMKVQWAAEPRHTGTDADVLQISRSGVATAVVSVPLRYMHTPVELCSPSDLESASRLIARTLLSVSARVDFTPY
jgi:endoglucanase